MHRNLNHSVPSFPGRFEPQHPKPWSLQTAAPESPSNKTPLALNPQPQTLSPDNSKAPSPKPQTFVPGLEAPSYGCLLRGSGGIARMVSGFRVGDSAFKD